jgi:hypothetical protein
MTSDTMLLLAAGFWIGWFTYVGIRASMLLLIGPEKRRARWQKFEEHASVAKEQNRLLVVSAVMAVCVCRMTVPLMALALLAVWL